MNMDITHVCLLIVGFIVSLTESTCSFPSTLVGDWTGADRGDVSITSTDILNYQVFIPSGDPANPLVAYYNFTCLEKVTDQRYTVKSHNFNVFFGTNIYFYICFDFYAIDNQMNYYYVATAVDILLQDNMIGIADGTSNSQDQICTKSSIDPRTFITLVRQGAVDNNDIQTLCPSQLQKVFSNLTVTDTAGVQDNCVSAQLDGCTNKTMMNFTHDGCAKKTQSADGLYTCLYSQTINDNVYFSAWNNDDTVDGTSTYRFSCFALTLSGDTLFLSETPKTCGETVNSTQITSGVLLEITEVTDTCEITIPTTTEAPFVANLNYLFLLVGLFGIFLFIHVIVLVRLLYKDCVEYLKRRKERKKEEKKKGEIVGHVRFDHRNVVWKNEKPVNYFKPKRPIQIVPIFSPNFSLDELPIYPPSKIPCLYTNSSMVDYMRGRLPRRPDGESLYSFDSAIFRSVSPVSTISIIGEEDNTSLDSVSC